MSLHSVRVNTFVQENEKLYVDPISKAFFITEAVLGIFRFPMTRSRTLFYLLSVFYLLLLAGFIIYDLFMYPPSKILPTIIRTSNFFKYFFCSLLGFACLNRTHLFFITLNRFDLEVGCRPKISRQCLQNFLQTIVTVFLICCLFTFPNWSAKIDFKLYFVLLLFSLSYTLEVDFCGHLFSILIPRLRLINYYLESSMSNEDTESIFLLNEFVSLKRGATGDLGLYRMKKLMDLYHILVEAYDFLIDAIKWQLLVIFITSFISTLGFLYLFAISFIKEGEIPTPNWLSKVGLAMLVFVPLFSPCYFGDQVHLEVKRLRELLACRLYENKLGKTGRSIARALLAFTETRDLSFRLLRMLNIDISLPFKFIGLMVTYLIILLQFDKVLGTDVSITNSTID